jgi:26S proteasome regulatory subunit N2
LVDHESDEPKKVLEEKLKKVTTERAPVAGQQPRGAGAGGRSGDRRSILEGLVDRGGSGDPLGQLLRGAGGRDSPFGNLLDPATPGGDVGSGAAAAAGVLTAVDEDQEGDVEAEVPGDFEYYSDGPSDEEEDE